MFWQHFWGGSVAVLDGNLLRGLPLKCTGVKGLGVKGGGYEVMRVLVWWHFLFGSTIKILTYSNIQGRGVSSSLPVSFLSPLLVCLHLFLTFYLSPTFSSFLFCLHLHPHFLCVSISIFIFCLSPSLYRDRQKMRIKTKADRQQR